LLQTGGSQDVLVASRVVLICGLLGQNEVEHDDDAKEENSQHSDKAQVIQDVAIVLGADEVCA
jgi:hypothetical protein